MNKGDRLSNIVAAALVLALCGCETATSLVSLGAQVAAGTGVISQEQAAAVGKLGESFKDITPEQEYYIGRSVGATIVTDIKPWHRDGANDYLNLLGQTLAQFSDLPQTFAGYHFLLLDSDEINAFAAPGGLIFVTRGMLRCCPTEDALAAVLAHEIGHVQLKHGLQAIKKDRLTSALVLLGTSSAKAYGAKDLSQLVGAFEGSVKDTVTTMVNNGYSRSFEYEADQAAATILRRAGYPTTALVVMLETMKGRLKPGGKDFAHTHPAPDDRIANLRAKSGNDGRGPATPSAARQGRFERALKGA